MRWSLRRPRIEGGGAVGYLETVNLARRSVLGLLGGMAASPLLPRRAGAAPDLPEIPLAPHRRPQPGLVEIDLDARPADVMVDGRRGALWTYGGSFPGKLIRVREGETVRLRFTNRLPEVTNLHFHGLHVPPTGRADNSWLHVPPDETFAYEFEVPRGGAGTYWYHPHAHGTLARQLWAGLSGPLVVDGPLEGMPELAAADERIVLLRDLALDEQGRPAPHRVMDWHEGKQGDLVLANGAVQPVLQARAGTVRLRLINASNARYFRLALAPDEPLHLIATDGHYLEAPVEVPEVLLVPGERADVLVQAGGVRPLSVARSALRSPDQPSFDGADRSHDPAPSGRRADRVAAKPRARAGPAAGACAGAAPDHDGDVLHERPAVRSQPHRRPRPS